MGPSRVCVMGCPLGVCDMRPWGFGPFGLVFVDFVACDQKDEGDNSLGWVLGEVFLALLLGSYNRKLVSDVQNCCA